MQVSLKGLRQGVIALLDKAPVFARRMWGRAYTKSEIDALVDRAMSARRAGDWVTAAKAWRAAINAAPNKPTWRLRAVEAAARAGLAGEAETWARSLSDDAVVKGEAALSAAAAMIDIGRYSEATALLQLATGVDVNRGWLLALSAQLKLAAGDLDEAWRLAEEAKAVSDPSGKTARVLKRCGLSGPRPRLIPAPVPAPESETQAVAETLEAVEAALDAPSGDEILAEPEPTPDPAPRAGTEPDPEMPAEILRALYRRVNVPHDLRVEALPSGLSEALPDKPATIAALAEAELMATSGNMDAALTRLKAVARRAPQSVAVAQALARVLRSKDDIDGSIAAQRRAVALDPRAERPRVDLARQLMRPGLYDQSLTEWLILFGMGAARGETLTQLARCLQKLDLHEASIEAFDLLVERQPLNLEGRLGRARSMQALGLPDAAEAWREVLRMDPTVEEAGVMLARTLGDAGDHEGAVAAIEAVLAHNKISDRLRVQKARLLMAAHEPGAAAEVLEAICAEQPDSLDRHVELGRALRALGDPARAIPVWRRAVELAPLHAEGLRSLAEAYEQIGQPASAQRVWEDRIAASDKEWEPLVQLARLQHRRDLHHDAALTYLRAADVAPDEIRVVIEAARYMARSRTTLFEGETLATRWMNLSPDSPDALVCRSAIRFRLGRPAEGEADLDDALRLAPMSVLALSTKARRLYAEQRWAEAEPVAELWREASGKSSEATDMLARILSNQGRNDEAEVLYREQRAANPGDIRAVLAVAEFCRRDRKLDEAVALWREALQIDPTSTAAWSELVVALANADREPEALAHFEAAQANLGDGPEALLSYAIMMDRGRFMDRAGAAYERAIAAAPDAPEPRRRYGLFLFRDGRLSEALMHLHAARNLDPQNWELALDLIDVIEALALIGLNDPVAVAKGPDLGPLIPERLFEMVVAEAPSVEPYEFVPGRVLLVTQSLAAGGAERQLAATVVGLADRKELESVHVSCLALDPNLGRDFYAGAIYAADVPIHSASPADIAEAWEDPIVRRYAGILRRLPADMGPVAWWLAQFRKLRPEVVHAWQDMTSLSVSIAAILAGAPRILLGTRSVRPDNPRRRLRRWMHHAYSQVLSLPNVELMNNSLAGGADYAEWLGIPLEKVDVVYNGLAFDALRKDANAIARSRVRGQLNVPPNAPLIGGVFRMSEEKRPMLWMETARKVAEARPDAHFVVCGGGPFYDEMAAYAEKHGFADRMHLPGVQSGIGKWFAAMDAVLLTSRHEGLPNVLIEAQSLGAPVVVPAVGGAPEVLVNGETGFAIPKATAAQMAERLLFILEDDAWREHAHTAAAEFIASRFSMDRMVQATMEVYFPGGVDTPRTKAPDKTAASNKQPSKSAAPTPPVRKPAKAKTASEGTTSVRPKATAKPKAAAKPVRKQS